MNPPTFIVCPLRQDSGVEVPVATVPVICFICYTGLLQSVAMKDHLPDAKIFCEECAKRYCEEHPQGSVILAHPPEEIYRRPQEDN